MKKMKLALLSAVLLISVGAISPALAESNNLDSYWANQYRVWSPNDHTPPRDKLNKTAYYNKVDSIENVSYINIWAALSDGRDVSAGHSYKAYYGDETFLYNLAVERYYPGVSVRIDSTRYANGSASGLWSPDSVR